MTTSRRGRALACAALACASLVAGGLAPPVADAGPLPPACDPATAGLTMPGCPSVLVKEVGRVEHSTFSLPDVVPDTREVYVDYEWMAIDNESGGWKFGPGVLNFDTWAHNQGRAPLDLLADDPTALEGSSVSQCVSWTTNFVCRDRRPVGGFTWHDDHKHFHFEGFAAYELRTLLPSGQPDFSPAGLVSTSPKVSVCLVDSRSVGPEAFPVPRYNACNPVEEGISPGWADVYPTGLDGQALSLRGVGNGRYALVISLDRDGRLFEGSRSNNRVVAIVEIAKLGSFFPEAAIVDKWVG